MLTAKKLFNECIKEQKVLGLKPNEDVKVRTKKGYPYFDLKYNEDNNEIIVYTEILRTEKLAKIQMHRNIMFATFKDGKIPEEYFKSLETIYGEGIYAVLTQELTCDKVFDEVRRCPNCDTIFVGSKHTKCLACYDECETEVIATNVQNPNYPATPELDAIVKKCIEEERAVGLPVPDGFWVYLDYNPNVPWKPEAGSIDVENNFDDLCITKDTLAKGERYLIDFIHACLTAKDEKGKPVKFEDPRARKKRDILFDTYGYGFNLDLPEDQRWD